MEKNADDSAVKRNAARGALVAERRARREAMSAVVGVGGGRLGRKVGVVMLDVEVFEDWVKDKGGDKGFMDWFCGQVASGVRVGEMCEHYGVQAGLLGGYLTEVPERLERYYRALSWVADGLVEETLEIAWGDGPDVVRDKLRVETHFRVAGKWDKKRFGEAKEVGSTGVPVINFVMGGGAVLVAGAPAEGVLEQVTAEDDCI